LRLFIISSEKKSIEYQKFIPQRAGKIGAAAVNGEKKLSGEQVFDFLLSHDYNSCFFM